MTGAKPFAEHANAVTTRPELAIRPVVAPLNDGGLPIAHLARQDGKGLCGADLLGFEPLGPFVRCSHCRRLSILGGAPHLDDAA
jgi:hypothetical protein